MGAQSFGFVRRLWALFVLWVWWLPIGMVCLVCWVIDEKLHGPGPGAPD